MSLAEERLHEAFVHFWKLMHDGPTRPEGPDLDLELAILREAIDAAADAGFENYTAWLIAGWHNDSPEDHLHCLLRALECFEKDPEVLEHLAGADEKKRAAAEGLRGRQWADIGLAYFKLGHKTEAREFLEKAIPSIRTWVETSEKGTDDHTGSLLVQERITNALLRLNQSDSERGPGG